MWKAITSIFLTWFCIVVAGASIVYSQDKTEGFSVDTNAYIPLPQGTVIPCEECVFLYPERYEEKPEKCPVCQGTKKHLQAARMMSREMAQMTLHEIDLEIQEFLHLTVLDTLDNDVTGEQLRKLRKLYLNKLIHLLVYDFIEVEPVADKIRQVDRILAKQRL